MTTRTAENVEIDRAWHMWQFALIPESAQLWQRRYEALVQKRKGNP